MHKMLDLTGKQLGSIPKDIFLQTRIKEVWFDDNKLKDLSEDVGRLTNLKNLSIYKNNLHTLPKALFQMINLEKINISVNNISYLSEEIGNLNKLKILDA